ncbi:MAG TPA: FAD-dependent monooxygenase [Terriglobales bacterium]|jgi:2-polyprenyl-6-methoxyphenol hydroxylase-like FAD-dependent oxidoreductase|nr:FAD-dependent monooxygenase [Terriglobales bacterium]
MYDTQVIIIGAGPTGLTLGIELARRSIAFRLIDAAEGPQPGSRGKGIQPRTLEVFEDLGVIGAVLEAGTPYPRFRVHLGPLSLRLGPLGGLKQVTERVPYPNLWLVPQYRTEEILRQHLAQLGGQVEFGTAFERVAPGERGVQVQLSSGELVTAEYLIGCDGGHSAVRKALGLALRGETLDTEAGFIADVKVEELDHTDWQVWPLARGGAIGLCPLPDHSLFQMMSRGEPAEGIEVAIQRVSGCPVTQIVWSSMYRPAVRMVDHLRVGRIFLAGDAAHLHPPTGGQGLNTGVQDAYNLGWKLAHVLRGGPQSLLDTYESERLPVAAAVLGRSKHIYRTGSLKRGEATNQLRLHYRTSALSSGKPFGRLHPGDRMPDLRLADGARLFEQMRGTHATEFITRDGTRILIRPDGYIGSIGRPPVATFAGEPTHRVDGSGTDFEPS